MISCCLGGWYVSVSPGVCNCDNFFLVLFLFWFVPDATKRNFPNFVPDAGDEGSDVILRPPVTLTFLCMIDEVSFAISYHRIF